MENGTGVYYQAMPAVGPDGKNVMKLIPVQKVNGKFVHTQVLSARIDRQPHVSHQPAHISAGTLPQNKLPTILSTTDGQYILKTPSDGNTLLNSVKSPQQGSNDLFKSTASQVRAPFVTPKMTHTALQLPLQNNSKAVTVINSPQQTGTAKIPVLSSGHYLQIPPNATVRTVPASALPQSIKSQICNSLNAPSNPAKSLPSVVYVSPVNSLKLGPSQQVTGFMKESEHTQSSTPLPCISSVKSLNVCSTSGPKTEQGATIPMKWVVQQGTRSTAPYLIPVTSPSMTSDIVKAVKQMETVKVVNRQDSSGEPTSTCAIQEKINPGKDNALVMCNGKVYFVAKKSSEITKDVNPVTGTNPNTRNSDQRSSTSNTALNSTPTLVSKNPNEIIDLCDDDEEGPGAASSRLSVLNEKASENDEDSNVIFVSYIPPKSETETSMKMADTGPQDNSGKDTDSLEYDAGNKEKACERTIADSPVISLDVTRCEDNAAFDEGVKRDGAVSEKSKDVFKEVTEKISVASGVQCWQSNKTDTEMPLKKTTLKEIQPKKSDSELRKTFGIMSDLRIGLQRVNQTTETASQPERRSVNKRTLEGIRKLIKESKIEFKVKQLINAQVPVSKEENGPEDAKRKRLEEDGQNTCSDTSLSKVINSSLQSKDTLKYHKKQSADASPDAKVLLYCEGPKEETPSTSGQSSKVAKQTVEPLCSSSSFARGNAHSTACMTVSRKTPARQNKGSGKMCTACPCGTKVGAIASISSSKPHEKSDAAIGSSKHVTFSTGSNRDCITVEKLPEKLVLSSPKTSVSSEKSGDESVLSDQLHIKPIKDLLQNVSCLTKQQDAVSQPGWSSGGATNSSSSSISSSSPSGFYSSVMLDPEEIKRQERIRRLKDLLKEKEAALEKLRQSM